MNQCRTEKTEPSTVTFQCLHDAGHDGPHKFFIPLDEDLLRKDRDALLLRNGELLRAVHNTRLAYCQSACKNYPLTDPRPSEHTEFCKEMSDFILHDGADQKAEVSKAVAAKSDLFIVRLWDGMDGIWCDVTGPVSKEDADRVWNQRTANGTKATKFDDIDYYCIFPADTVMRYRSGQSLMGLEDRDSSHSGTESCT